MKEWLQLPVGTLEQIIECRAYAATKSFYETNPKTQDRSELMQLVKRIEFEIAGEEIEQRRLADEANARQQAHDAQRRRKRRPRE